MILRLDPGIPRVWRSPLILQFGLDERHVILRDLTSAEERVIHALESGVSRDGLDMLAAASGLSRAGVDALLAKLEPVLHRPTVAAERFALELVGNGPTPELVARALGDAGVAVRRHGVAGESQQPSRLGLAIGHFVLDPRLHRHWLRSDIPHLAVVIGDASARVGPIVVPGETACLNCIERRAVDADPAWPAMAAQLLGRRSAAESALLSLEAAAITVRAVLAFAERGERMSHIARVDAATGRIRRSTATPHPDCGCLVPQGNDSAAAPQSAAALARPMTQTGSDGRE